LLTRLRLLQNVGQFASTGSPPTSPLTRYVLIYAENGRGKTTLSAIFHSLKTGDPVLINERHRLGVAGPSLVVIQSDAGFPPFLFQDGAWNRTLSDMVIFDDRFVNENVYSGLTVEPDHRQNLHELVIGSQGVALNRQLQDLVRRIEVHNAEPPTRIRPTQEGDGDISFANCILRLMRLPTIYSRPTFRCAKNLSQGMHS
jgi:wobble nucleotide-excising tRNase